LYHAYQEEARINPTRDTSMPNDSSYDGQEPPVGARPGAIPSSLLESLDLVNMDIPGYVCAKQAMLSFPEKVSFAMHATVLYREAPTNNKRTRESLFS
jgi:hypothetical protein